ncbi:MAG: response regulator [Brevundimonas sp.]
MADLGSLTVLIVDDSEQMRAIAATVLAGAGVRGIRSVESGASALEVLRTEEIDVAIVDYRMTPMNGIEFVRLVRNCPASRNPYLPIVMMTGHADLSLIREARDAGVTEFLVKPITARALIDRLQAVILRPRPFVKLAGYFGPDRRRIEQPDRAERRRATDPSVNVD